MVASAAVDQSKPRGCPLVVYYRSWVCANLSCRYLEAPTQRPNRQQPFRASTAIVSLGLSHPMCCFSLSALNVPRGQYRGTLSQPDQSPGRATFSKGDCTCPACWYRSSGTHRRTVTRSNGSYTLLGRVAAVLFDESGRPRLHGLSVTYHTKIALFAAPR